MKSETIERVASWAAGVGAAAFFSLLFVAMSSPAAETVARFIS